MTRYRKVSGEVIATKIIGSCINTPMTLDQLVELIYPVTTKAGFNSCAGRVYHAIEALVETGCVVPVVIKGKLMYRFSAKVANQ